jgi:hypothetical protein
MQMRRFTRLTNAFSKKFENHMHMIALYTVWYNYVKPAQEPWGPLARDVRWRQRDAVEHDRTCRNGGREPAKLGARGPYKKAQISN